MLYLTVAAVSPGFYAGILALLNRFLTQKITQSKGLRGHGSLNSDVS